MTTNNLFSKGVAVCAFLLVFNLQLVSAQVGIGTNTPDASSALDVTSTTAGVLFPRLTTAQRDAIPGPVNGLIIFNTDTDAFEYYYADAPTPLWVSLKSSLSVKYNSTDTTIDFSGAVGTVTNVPLFSNLILNDDTTLFNVQSTTSIQIAEAGRYRISFHLYFNGNVQLRGGIFVNGVMQGTPTTSTGNNLDLFFGVTANSSAHMSEILTLSANDVITIAFGSNLSNGTANLTTLNTRNSTVQIEKIN